MPKPLLPGERIVYKTHLHWMMLLKALALPGLLALSVLALDFAIGRQVAVAWRLAVALAALVVVAGFAANAWVRWAQATLTVTDQRMVVAQGVTFRLEKVIPVERFNNVIIRQSLTGQLLRYGTLEIAAPGMTTPATLPFIPAPHEVMEILFVQMRAPRA